MGQFIGPIAYYHLSLWLVAALLGLTLRWVVHRTRLDRRYRFFQYDNEWHYLLSGEILDFPRLDGVGSGADGIELRYVDALLKVDNAGMLYRGLLVEYTRLSTSGYRATICKTPILEMAFDATNLHTGFYCIMINVFDPLRESLHYWLRRPDFREQLLAAQDFDARFLPLLLRSLRIAAGDSEVRPKVEAS